MKQMTTKSRVVKKEKTSTSSPDTMTANAWVVENQEVAHRKGERNHHNQARTDAKKAQLNNRGKQECRIKKSNRN
jgi:hypothetical protein